MGGPSERASTGVAWPCDAAPAAAMAPVAQRQSALVLHRIGQEYRVVTDHVVPRLLRPGEVLVKTAVIGLNPIDWKAPCVLRGSVSATPFAMADAGAGYTTLASRDCPLSRGESSPAPCAACTSTGRPWPRGTG